VALVAPAARLCGFAPIRPRLRLAGQIGLIAIGSAVIGGGWDLVANRHDPADVRHEPWSVYLSTDPPTGWRCVVRDVR